MLPWEKAIAALERRVLGEIERVRSIVEFVTTKKHSADGTTDAVTLGDEQRPVRRVEPFGFASYPPEGLMGVVVKALGGASNAILVGVAGTRYRPSGLASGDSVQYSTATDARVKVAAAGTVQIDAAAGQDVVVNGGSLKVARDTDPTADGTLTAVLAQVGPTLTVTITYTPQGGAPAPWFAFSCTGTGTPGTYNASITGLITNGATRFKG